MTTAPTHPNALPVFTKATRKRVLLRMAITGPSGSGKTYTALTIGQGIAQATGLRLAVLDTEHGSAEKYADLFDFDHLVMANYAARNYEVAIQAAQDGQHSVLVIDSLSHAWAGIGGTLDTVDRYASGHRGDSFGGWREARPEQRALVEAMLGARLHIIVTMRSKQAWEVEKDERGKTRVRKLGLKPEQTDGIEYEFDVAGDMDTDHQFTITKTRAPALNGRIYTPPGADLVGELLDWIKPTQGVPEQPEPTSPDLLRGSYNAAVPDTVPASHAPEQTAAAEAAEAQVTEQAEATTTGAFPADGEEDKRAPSKAQQARLHAMLNEIELVQAGHLDKHDLANYVLRDTGRTIGSMTELTRTGLDRVFAALEWMKADPENAMKLMEAATKWAAEQPAQPTPEGVPA